MRSMHYGLSLRLTAVCDVGGGIYQEYMFWGGNKKADFFSIFFKQAGVILAPHPLFDPAKFFSQASCVQR